MLIPEATLHSTMNSRYILAFALVAFTGLATLLTSFTPPEKPIGLEALDGFVGTWVAVGEDGKPTELVMSDVRSTAGGSVLIETMFPGTENEMITMYYTREGHLMMTHYCGCTNHPILKASRGEAGALKFDCIGSGENFANCAKTPHMHDAVFHLNGDSFQSKWRMLDSGEFTHVGDFKLVRKPKKKVKVGK